MAELYRITHEDCSIFLGGTLENSKWNEIVKPIRELLYVLPNKTVISLKNYEAYNHQIIKKNIILSQKSNVFGILLIAKRKNLVDCFSFNLKTEKINHYVSEYTKKFQPPFMTGWKIGNLSNNSSFSIL